jgi:hypothetical protein
MICGKLKLWKSNATADLGGNAFNLRSLLALLDAAKHGSQNGVRPLQHSDLHGFS